MKGLKKQSSIFVIENVKFPSTEVTISLALDLMNFILGY